MALRVGGKVLDFAVKQGPRFYNYGRRLWRQMHPAPTPGPLMGASGPAASHTTQVASRVQQLSQRTLRPGAGGGRTASPARTRDVGGPHTKSNLQHGQKKHTEYRRTEVLDGVREKNTLYQVGEELILSILIKISYTN